MRDQGQNKLPLNSMVQELQCPLSNLLFLVAFHDWSLFYSLVAQFLEEGHLTCNDLYVSNIMSVLSALFEVSPSLYFTWKCHGLCGSCVMLTGGLLFQHRIFNVLQNSLDIVYQRVLFISWESGFLNVGITCSHMPCSGLKMYSVTSNVDQLEPSYKFSKMAVWLVCKLECLGIPFTVLCLTGIGGLRMFLTANFSIYLFFPFPHYFPVQAGNCCVLFLCSIIAAVFGCVFSSLFFPHM